MQYDDFEDETHSFRDLLALDRTILANERTMLAYARTSVMLLVSSITLFKVFYSSFLAVSAATALLPISIGIALLGIRRYLQLSSSLSERRKS